MGSALDEDGEDGYIQRPNAQAGVECVESGWTLRDMRGLLLCSRSRALSLSRYLSGMSCSVVGGFHGADPGPPSLIPLAALVLSIHSQRMLIDPLKIAHKPPWVLSAQALKT